MLNSPNRRLAREAKTIQVMIRTFCRDMHQVPAGLCAECQELSDYAALRLVKCPFGPEKPTCANCKIHCYRPEMRERIRAVMRYAGPRMLARHPVLSIWHLVDGRRPTPAKPTRKGDNLPD